MRPILFRGKSLHTGEWCYGDLATSAHDPTAVIIDGEGFYPVDPDTVGECTGASDIYGRPIYEGDVISFHDELTGSVFMGEVIFADCSFAVQTGMAAHSRWADYSRMIILGNSFDDPELLDEGCAASANTDRQPAPVFSLRRVG